MGVGGGGGVGDGFVTVPGQTRSGDGGMDVGVGDG